MVLAQCDHLESSHSTMDLCVVNVSTRNYARATPASDAFCALSHGHE